MKYLYYKKSLLHEKHMCSNPHTLIVYNLSTLCNKQTSGQNKLCLILVL